MAQFTLTYTRCGVRTHASNRRPDLKSGALNHSANLVLIETRQGKIRMRKGNSKDCGMWNYHKLLLLKLLWLELLFVFRSQYEK
jgi:hypothetical protein